MDLLNAARGFIECHRGRGARQPTRDVIWRLPLHTTLLQMVPSSSISHCTSSPLCEGQGDAGSPLLALFPARGGGGSLMSPLCHPSPILSHPPPSPHLKKHGWLLKSPHTRRGSRQQDVPGDQRDKPGVGDGGDRSRQLWPPPSSGATGPPTPCLPGDPGDEFG